MMKLVVAAALALGANAGCDSLNCFDGAGLEAKYDEGVERAAVVNGEHFAQGKAAGLALTRTDGERDGEREGYDAGFSAGYHSAEGYAAGYADAYDDGAIDGSYDTNACAAGGADGYADGSSDGYGDAYSDGHADGYSSGYSAGGADGAAACDAPALVGGSAKLAGARTTGAFATVASRGERAPVAAPQGTTPPAGDDVDPHDARVCYDRGFDENYNADAFDQGLAEGKRLNPEYQAGYRATFDPAFARGERDGVSAGYADGALDGYDDGYADAAGAIYDGCYADGYSAGYADGGASGYDAGYGDGYDSGYTDGWNNVTCS